MNTIIYTGQWKYDKKNGEGILYKNDNMIYNGQWFNDAHHGFGELYFEDGKTEYQGEWNNNKRNGNGIQYYKNGHIQYQGMWLNEEKSYGKHYDHEGTLLFNGPQQNLNKEMKEFIKETIKSDNIIDLKKYNKDSKIYTIVKKQIITTINETETETETEINTTTDSETEINTSTDSETENKTKIETKLETNKIIDINLNNKIEPCENNKGIIEKIVGFLGF